MIVAITTADYLEGYRLLLHFNTGESGEVDLQDIIFKYNAASPLRSIDSFKKFKLDGNYSPPTEFNSPAKAI